jgi:hypothetical protein
VGHRPRGTRRYRPIHLREAGIGTQLVRLSLLAPDRSDSLYSDVSERDTAGHERTADVAGNTVTGRADACNTARTSVMSQGEHLVRGKPQDVRRLRSGLAWRPEPIPMIRNYSPPDWHAIATMITWLMTIFIQRAEHRDTQAIHAKIDELLRTSATARNSLTRLDEAEPEDIERHRLEERRD